MSDTDDDDDHPPLASRPDQDYFPSPEHPMQYLIDRFLVEKAPQVTLADGSVDTTTPRAVENVQIMFMGSVIAGTLSETLIPGVYRLMMPGKNQQTGETTLAEVFFPADKVTSILIERKDLADMARQAARQAANGGKSAIWTP